MKKDGDKLYNIFEHYLFNGLVDDHSSESLITMVVDDFISYLLSIGHIPGGSLDSLKSDLTEEVTEMYRKKTYGHSRLTDFRLAQEKSETTQRKHS